VLFVVALVFSDLITQAVLQPHRDTVAKLNVELRAESEARVAAHPEERALYFEPDGTFRQEIDARLDVLSPTEGMWFQLQVAGYFALFIGSPFLLWQLWQFVAAGLYDRERRWVRAFFPPALLLFLAGVLFSYFVLVPFGLYYLMKVPREQLRLSIRLSDYFSFLSILCLGMGLVFQLPVLMTFLGKVGIVAARASRASRLLRRRRLRHRGRADARTRLFSQVAMAAPMILLYEIGIVGARVAGRRSEPVPVEGNA
jgi:sec-independent protein translocase protein TatC